MHMRVRMRMRVPMHTHLEHHVVLDIEEEMQHALAQPEGGCERSGGADELLGLLLREP